MRRRAGDVGALLIYGPDQQPRDMVAALKILLEDLQQDERRIGDLHLSRRRLSLSTDAFDLSAALSASAIPAAAFAGVTRPRPLADESGDWARNISQGRLLHSLRRHSCALSLDLSVGPGSAVDDPAVMPAGLRAMILALDEVAPSQFVLWRPSNVLFSWAEFATCDLGQLSAPGDPENWVEVALRDGGVPHPPAQARAAGTPAREAAGIDAYQQSPPVTARSSERTERRPNARIFRRADPLRRAPSLPSIDRQQTSLRQALREAEADEAVKAVPRRPTRRFWLMGLVVLTLSLLIALPTWSVI